MHVMKNNLIPIAALLIGMMISSFTVKDCISIYLIYNSGAQNSRSSYTETTTPQSTVLGTTVLVWIRICVPGGTITNAEFDCVFEELDTVNDSSNSLNDEVEKTITVSCSFVVEAQLEKGIL